MLPAEVAAVFRVDPKTVSRWAAAGRIDSIRTPGGHRRFSRAVVMAYFAEFATPTPDNPPNPENSR
ncbi:BldC family transcriptional regulator [Microbispora bryophytorum]|uniref:BldC family transcriptional regulator n=1 Tax=Microbispora bryophytorum TaxID=1460882 RepID=UPI0033F12360